MSIEYYEAQYARSKKAMENKNAQLWKEWREDFDKRQELKEEDEYPYAWNFKVC
jgi:hypothetical protein